MVSLGNVSIDGSKIAANASKRKAMSYSRMVRTEEDIRLQIAEIQRRSNAADAQEDSLFGKDNIGFDVPKELKRHETRLARILAAKKQLEAEARQAAEAKAAEHKAKQSNNDGGKPRRGPKPKEPEDPAKAVPKDSAQRGFTDPDSRIMKSGTGEWIQGYNAQAAVDGQNQVILACELTQEANDRRMLVPMVEKTIAQVGAKPAIFSADPGFYSGENAKAMEDMGVNALIPPDKERCGTPDNPAPATSEEEFAALSTKEKMRHRVSTAEGRDAYRLRKGIVEPDFGQIKGSAGNPGYIGFLRRGLPKVTQEWSWVCATHNFLKYVRFLPRKKHHLQRKNKSAAAVEGRIAPSGQWKWRSKGQQAVNSAKSRANRSDIELPTQKERENQAISQCHKAVNTPIRQNGGASQSQQFILRQAPRRTRLSQNS
jgi:hypothetical protein